MVEKRGKEAFLEYYQSVVFPDQKEFNSFRGALEKTNLPVLRFSPQNAARLWKLWQEKDLSWQPLSWYPYALLWPKEVAYGQLLPGFKQKLFYPMNASSLLPVLALNIQPGDLVLDACAAPGGKTLFLKEFIDKNGQLIANDLSRARVQRMRQVFKEYGVFDISIWQQNAATIFRRFPNHFDKILLDSPCSSEKHIFNNPKQLKIWSKNRVKFLQKRQLALLGGLILALKPGGRLVYSTCAVTPEENEAVVAQFLTRKRGEIRLCPWKLATPGGPGLPGKYTSNFDLIQVGRILFNQEGLDPMFVAVFEKI